MASPAPTDNPCPREPVAASTPGIHGVGWPSISLSIVRSVISRPTGITPASASTAYKIGAAWPFDSTKRSPASAFGFFGSNFIVLKNSAAIISAIDRHDVGCPDPACVVMRREWLRSMRALSASAEIFDVGMALCGIAVMAAPVRCVSIDSQHLLYRTASHMATVGRSPVGRDQIGFVLLHARILRVARIP